MEPQTETQEKVIVEQVPDRQLEREAIVDARFEKIEAQLSLQPTKAEFETMLNGLAKQSDISRLNNIVHTFTIGAQIIEKSSKIVFYAIVGVGGVVAGILVIKNGFILLLAWLGFTQLK